MPVYAERNRAAGNAWSQISWFCVNDDCPVGLIVIEEAWGTL